jgi:salicylate hydroxylase
MLPFMAQGAAQSIEDGATLAACLRQDRAADLASALRRYEALRRPRATRLQEMSRANKTRYNLPDGLAQQARDAELATRGDRTIAALGWLYGHDAWAIDGDPETDQR